MTCDRCFQLLTDGTHGEGHCPYEARRSTPVVSDEIPGGQYFENGFDQPTRFDSHSAHRAALAARGLEIAVKWAGPHDRHVTRWDTVDLEAAAVLVGRGADARAAKRQQAHLPITVTRLTVEKPPCC